MDTCTIAPAGIAEGGRNVKWFLIAVLAAMPLIPALVSLIPNARKDDEVMRDWCEVCTRWPECNGVDDQCPWNGRE